MQEIKEQIKAKIEDADFVLVGIGEEFDCMAYLSTNEKYKRVCGQLVEQGLEALLPYVNSYFLRDNTKLQKAYLSLAQLLKEKDVFVVSTCMTAIRPANGWDTENMVEPCGSTLKLQCQEGCEDALFYTPKEYIEQLEECIEKEADWEMLKEHKCGVCGHEMVFNTLYARHYLEAGYLPKWSDYTSWLQRTINKKLCILELGVGLKYPSVIRWPFEKTAFYNKKSYFVRVHEKLSQLTPDLKEKGIGIAVNAVEFLTDL